MALKDKVTDKILGGRYFATVMIITTYCILMLACMFLVVKNLVTSETFMGMFTAFALLAKEIIQNYFNRSDREQPKNGGNGHEEVK